MSKPYSQLSDVRKKYGNFEAKSEKENRESERRDIIEFDYYKRHKSYNCLEVQFECLGCKEQIKANIAIHKYSRFNKSQIFGFVLLYDGIMCNKCYYGIP